MLSDATLNKVRSRLEGLYGEQAAARVMNQLKRLVRQHLQLRRKHQSKPSWDASDILLISYGDSIQAPGVTPLQALADFAERRLKGVVSIIHLLPFFPYSSDDGFSVVDFRAVSPDLGHWRDVAALNEHFDLMFDLVLNHMSRENLWFVDFIDNEPPGRDYFIELDPTTNVSMVVRPRSTPLLTPVMTRDGQKHVWTTFSHDQVDLDYRNPDVLMEFVDILLYYIRRGARVVRLDAVGFLWKELGTNCIHLPQTHEIVKLMRDLLEDLEPGCVLLTETNVPHKENVSYFGDGDEAHMVYQFSLPPLILHAIHRQTTRYLTPWALGLGNTPLPPSCTYLNFTASHDGIGVRPLEGLVPKQEIDLLVESIRARGGYLSVKTDRDGGESPYELNISYYDAFRDPNNDDDSVQIAQFLLSQTVPLSLQGVPAVYINAITAAFNDRIGVERSGMTRRINRRKWDQAELERLLDNPASAAGRVFPEYVRRLRIRREIAALHPDVPQTILPLQDGLFGVIRDGGDPETYLAALYNFTSSARVVGLDSLHERFPKARWRDRLGDTLVNDTDNALLIPPYSGAWLSPTGTETATGSAVTNEA